MKTIAALLTVLCLVLPSRAQKVSDMPAKYTIAGSDLVMITVPGVNNYKTTFLILASNLNGLITVTATVTNAVATGSNLSTTNATSFGLFSQVSNLTNMQFFSIKQGTNMVIYRDGSNIVLNATSTGGGGGDGSFGANASQFTTNAALTLKDSALTTNLNAAGVVLITGAIFQNSSGTNINVFFASNYFGGRIQIASGSPGVSKVLTSDVDGNASWEVPTGGVTPTQLNTASNFLYTTETTRNGVVSNALTSLLVANDTFTSNALRAALGSTQMVVASFGNANVTNTITANTLSVVDFNASNMTLTNAMGSNAVRLGYQDLTNIVRRQTIWAGAGAMISNSTAGATFSTEETSSPTNRMFDSYVFSGTVTNVVSFNLAMPLNWNLSTVRVRLWTSSTNNIATTTNVWAVSAAAIKTTQVATNVDWGTELTITNAVSSAGGQLLLTPATPALTVGNSPSSAGQVVWFRIRRLPGHVDDNDGGVQKLLGAWVQYGETMSEVASW